MVRAVSDGRAREIERRRERLNHLRGLRVAGRRDLLLRDHVHRHGLFCLRADCARSDCDVFGGSHRLRVRHADAEEEEDQNDEKDEDPEQAILMIA